MSTMQDVARKAKVSLSTVSYVLSGTRPVSEETKKRVRKAMQALGYRPHAVARGLASKKTRILALVFSPPERGIGLTEVDFVTMAAEAARQRTYHLVLWTIEPGDVESLADLLGQNLIDGVILMEVLSDDARISLLESMDIPFTLIGRSAYPESRSFADIDTVTTLEEAVAHLYSLGHRRICFAGQSREILGSGYGPSLLAHRRIAQGFGDPELHVGEFHSHADPALARQGMEEWLDRNPGTTACIIMNDRIIPGILAALKNRNLRVPRDFSLVSILSSLRVAELFDPPLCTWSVPACELAKASVGQLVSIVEHGEREKDLLLPCHRESGASCAPVTESRS